jgi:phosphoribosylanthranilate isomerase
LHAEICGADAIGVVVFSDSPRNVPLEQAQDIFSVLDPATLTVAVTHTRSEEELKKILLLNPGAVQISHPFLFPANRSVQVFRVIKPGDPLRKDTDAFVVDESHGYGKRFNLSFARDVVRRSSVPVFLAGGLKPENVRQAIAEVRPDAVDVSSGVESSPGIKDKEKIRCFIGNCREAIF